ncbi:type 1 fimbrial protein, partial [Klebsiella pneumoniae]
LDMTTPAGERFNYDFTRALDKSNKIVPADPQQNQVRLQESAVSGGLFTYYVGYVSPTPKSATSGPITSWATWELVYN